MMRRDRRAATLGLAIVIAALLVLRGVPAALRAEHTLRSKVEEKTSLAMRLRAETAALPTLEDSAKALQSALVRLAPQLIAGTTAIEGQAELSVVLRSLAEGLGAQVERVTAVPDSASAGSLARVRVRLEGESDARGIAQFLAAVKRHPTVLEVVSLRLMALEPGSPGTVAERVRIEIVVQGWLLTSRSNTSTGAGS